MAPSGKQSGISFKSKQAELPPVIDRFELKYTIPLSMVESISRFIEPYCSMDKYSEIAQDGFYTINSLYWDTPQYFFLRQRLEGAEKRFNMRIRSYGKGEGPFFLEIKQRLGDIVRKHRARVDADGINRLHTLGSPENSEERGEPDPKADLFHHTILRYNAQPAVLVQYRRKAYISDVDDYARVTFDTDLRYMHPNGYFPAPIEEAMKPSDCQTCFDAQCCVILELKCYTAYVPLWMVDCVRAFQLKRRGFSKYATCLRPILQNPEFGRLLYRRSALPDYY